MEKSVLGGLVSALLWTSSAAFGQAGPPVTITLDENCNGTLDFGTGNVQALPCSLLPDPGPGGLPLALTYNLLGGNPIAGDLILLEPGGSTAPITSDVIRFNAGQNGGTAVFYSDIPNPGDSDLADTGFPNAFYTNVLTVTEVGPEGNNGFTYTPGANEPGFVPGFTVTYVLRSDVTGIPEPASAGLILAGAGILLARRHMLKRRAS
jgi:hypothetical protein